VLQKMHTGLLEFERYLEQAQGRCPQSQAVSA
jgi:hypothetical protein